MTQSEQHRIDDFLETFRSLEKSMKNDCKGNVRSFSQALSTISNDPQHKKSCLVQKYKGFLDKCREIRNFYSHTSNKAAPSRGYNDIENDYPYLITPSPEFLKDFKKIQSTYENPEMSEVLECYISYGKIYSVKPNCNIFEQIKYMDKNSYSHAPLLDDQQKVIGILDDQFFRRVLLNEKGLPINNSSKIGDYLNICINSLKNNDTIEFMKLSDSLEDVEKKFSNSIKKEKRLSMILFTDTGDINGTLKGLTTIWDLFRI